MAEVTRPDQIGRELIVGDWVAFPNPRYIGQGLSIGKIVRFTPKGITVGFKRKIYQDRWSDETYNVSGSNVIKLDGPELLAHLLKRDFG
jgi:hypothetical protein